METAAACAARASAAGLPPDALRPAAALPRRPPLAEQQALPRAAHQPLRGLRPPPPVVVPLPWPYPSLGTVLFFSLRRFGRNLRGGGPRERPQRQGLGSAAQQADEPQRAPIYLMRLYQSPGRPPPSVGSQSGGRPAGRSLLAKAAVRCSCVVGAAWGNGHRTLTWGRHGDRLAAPGALAPDTHHPASPGPRPILA